MSTQENLLTELSKNQLLEKLEKQESRYNGLFQNSLVAMMTFDSIKGKINNANEKCLDLLGIKNIYSRDFYSFLKDSDRQKIEFSLAKDGAIDNIELEIQINGNSRWLSCSAKIKVSSPLTKSEHLL